MRSVAQVPAPGGPSSDDEQHEVMAIAKPSDPLVLSVYGHAAPSTKRKAADLIDTLLRQQRMAP